MPVLSDLANPNAGRNVNALASAMGPYDNGYSQHMAQHNVAPGMGSTAHAMPSAVPGSQGTPGGGVQESDLHKLQRDVQYMMGLLGLAGASGVAATGGGAPATAAVVGPSVALGANAQTDNIRDVFANQVFQAEGPTGGPLGSVSDRELEMMRAASRTGGAVGSGGPVGPSGRNR